MGSNKMAFIFPGQGSQYIGMGKDLLENFPYVKEIFDCTDEICKRNISRLCFEGPMEELTLTENLQPAITAVSLACLSVIHRSGINADLSAGHSLGEYSALVSAGVVNSFDAIRLVQKRGELMHRESLKRPGGMAAIIGLDIKEVQALVDKARDHGVLAVANHNTAEQIVISGEKEPLSKAMQMAKDKNARAIPLKVSGAWHCELMKDAATEFREFMKEIPFSEPKSRIIFNSTADEEKETENIKDIMANQLISPVRWYDSIINMLKDGVNTFVEIGPRKVLTGLLRKILPKKKDMNIYNVEDAKSLDKFLNLF